MYLRSTKRMIADGAQQMERGIQRGHVRIIRMSTQKHSPTRTKKRLLCRNISSSTIRENNMNLSKNFAVFLVLPLTLTFIFIILFLEESVYDFEVFFLEHKYYN